MTGSRYPEVKLLHFDATTRVRNI